ncbi:MAG: LuxR C-terminal-related transcriptional regulator, partial [Armatimonadota bacterium]|nr:LuxR C-terminal-related transcriptional regulator [Armatimonadota bacterium]
VLRLAAAVEQPSEHPYGRAVVSAARERGLAVPSVDGFGAMPGAGVRGRVEGKDVLVESEGALRDDGLLSADAERWGKEAASRGETYLYPSMATALVADYLRRVESGEETGAYEELTPREREILKLIAEGYTSAEIGELLHLSVKTVQAHRQHIMEKLDLHRPAQLIKYAIRKGLVEADS